MSFNHTSSKEGVSSLQPGADSTRLQGGALVLARGVWIVGVVVVLVIFFASTLAYFAALHVVGSNQLNLQYGNQLTPADLRQLRALGLSSDFYAAYLVVISGIFVLAWFVVGGLIFWRKSDDRMAFFASFALMIFSVTFAAGNMVGALPPGWWVPIQSVRFIGGMGLSVFFYVFPDGRFVPRWTRWLLIGWVIHELFGDTLFVNASFNPFNNFPWVDGVLFISLLVSLVVVQVYRYRRVSNPVQRQQTKWVVFGFAVELALGLVSFFLTLLVPSLNQPGSLYQLLFNIDTGISPLNFLLPLCFCIAILRYRLWDIDVLINRTLVYGTLTAILALVYFGLVIGLQFLFRELTSQVASSPLIIVGSTLAIAALFQPLRRRIQSAIDRRFYRRKYDAAKTLAHFSAILRDEVDLNRLSEQLVEVVEETMQPAHVSLWLRKPKKE